MNQSLSFKIDLTSRIKTGEGLKIELGCGPAKKNGYIGIDNVDLVGVDIVANLENGLPFLPDNSVDSVYTSHFLEHVNNFEKLMAECFRVLKRGGRMDVVVPHFSNPYFYSDYTHRRFFGLYTFHYFSEQKHQLERKVPTFYTDIRFRVLSQYLGFFSPFQKRNKWKKRIGKIFNRNSYWQELYEENFCYIFPCYELRAILTPEK